MPARAPPLSQRSDARLRALGAQLRAKRKQLEVSATVAAEAAGMSRATLHRIERGEPSVTMGAYLNAAMALGLGIKLDEALRERTAAPAKVRLASYPELERLAWQLKGVKVISARQALDLYERNWRHVDIRAMGERERALVRSLALQFGEGRLLV